jgi:hypothetical protein
MAFDKLLKRMNYDRNRKVSYPFLKVFIVQGIAYVLIMLGFTQNAFTA